MRRLQLRDARHIAALAAGLTAIMLSGVASGAASTRPTRPAGARGVLHGVGRGVVYRHDEAGVRAAKRQLKSSSCSVSCSGPLEYHGGPVMHSHTTYAIYWAPPAPAANGQLGTTFTPFESTYKSTIDTFLERVGADSGKLTNVYSVEAQYGEPGGGIYSSTFGSAFNDEKLYPARNTTLCPESANGGEDFLPLGEQPCLTDSQIKAELKSFVKEHSLPSGLGAMYFLFTPQGVASCAGGSGSTAECSTNVYCAYHFETASPTLIYANMPYDHVPGCETPAEPNGTPADDEASVISHEHNEALSDPTGEGWYHGEFVENGDKCTYPFFNPGEDSNESTDAYGPLLGGSSGSTGYNQEIGGGHYLLQREWSNAAAGCVTQAPPLTASFSAYSSPGVVGQAVSFNGASSSTSAGVLTSYNWEFGDGGSASGAQSSHVYSSPGTYTVRLTVTNDSGASASTSQQVTIGLPQSPVVTTTTTTATRTIKAAIARYTAAGLAKLLGLPGSGATRAGAGTIALGSAQCPPACGVSIQIVASVREGKHVKHLQIGSLKKTIASGGKESIALQLTKKGRELLRKKHHLPVVLIVAVEEGSGASWKIERKLTLTSGGKTARRARASGPLSRLAGALGRPATMRW